MTFELFQKLMSFDTKSRFCIEILFSVKGNEKFDCCWMGKMPDKKMQEQAYNTQCRNFARNHYGKK